MNIYHLLADLLLLREDCVFHESPINGQFGFHYMKDYSGKMARPGRSGKVRQKQGYFDFIVRTGSRYKGHVTHRDMFKDLLRYSTEEKCLEVWRGKDPREVGDDFEEIESLITFLLLMFEQEVNWGNEVWQKWSNFAPKKTRPKEIRPRDMMMGYVRQAFDLGINRLDDLKFWMRTKPGTVSFRGPKGESSSYQDYPEKYKRYFTELTELEGTEALMIGDTLRMFKAVVSKAPDSPYYQIIMKVGIR